MNKFEVNALLDQYSGLLTEKAQQICDEYYRNDLSYQEIAEEMHVSRSAIYDTIRRSKDELQHYEDVMECHASQKKRRKIYDAILGCTDDQNVIDLVHKLIQIEEE